MTIMGEVQPTWHLVTKPKNPKDKRNVQYATHQGSTNAGTIAAEIAMSVRYSGCDHGWSDSQPPTNL